MGCGGSKIALTKTNKKSKNLSYYHIGKYGFYPDYEPNEIPKNFNSWIQLRQNISQLMKEEKQRD